MFILFRYLKMKCVAIILISLAVAAVMSNPMQEEEGADVCHDAVKPVIEAFCAGKDQVLISTTIFAQFCTENLSDYRSVSPTVNCIFLHIIVKKKERKLSKKCC